MDRIKQLKELLDFSAFRFSDILPSVWAEQNMRVTSGKFQGMMSYERTPYSRQILDCFSPYHYATEITLCGGAQWGKSTSVIEPLICYTMAENPCNIGFLTGHSDLSEEAMIKLDNAIHSAKLGHLIRPALVKPRNSRTGDTTKYKEFAGGSIISGSATNHKLLRQRSWQVIVADDLEAAKGASKESGSTIALIRERAKSFGGSKKIMWCSTPELKASSLIWELFLAGDQNRWHWPCPKCGERIYLQWVADVRDSEDKAGFTWKIDGKGRLITGSVEYICQCCGRPFSEKHKHELNLNGIWIPMAEAEDPTHVSFHLPSLYAPVGMNGWEQAVRDYLKANPANGAPQNRKAMQTFVNLTLGECYEEETKEVAATEIMRNIRRYDIGVIPNGQSIKDGNGEIMLLTCAIDLNGKIEDARLDYEIVGWSREGASYSIIHGSIGTFVRGEGEKSGKMDRELWTYQHGQLNNVWRKMDEILDTIYVADDGSKRMKVYITGLDTGNFTAQAYEYLERSRHTVIGLKGDTEEKYNKLQHERSIFKKATNRTDLYILKVDAIKDMLSQFMGLTWDRSQPTQPLGFMNFPQPSEGLYGYENYFEHYEAERYTHKINSVGEMVGKWEKKTSMSQNHMWDCRVYNIAMKEIFLSIIGKQFGVKELTWQGFCNSA